MELQSENQKHWHETEIKMANMTYEVRGGVVVVVVVGGGGG